MPNGEYSGDNNYSVVSSFEHGMTGKVNDEKGDMFVKKRERAMLIGQTDVCRGVNNTMYKYKDVYVALIGSSRTRWMEGSR